MIRSGTILDTTELEGSPFAAVIAEYRRHVEKIINRKRRRNLAGDIQTIIYCGRIAAALESAF